MVINFDRELTQEEFEAASNYIWEKGVLARSWESFIDGLTEAVNKVEVKETLPIEEVASKRKDNSILSEGIVNTSTDEKMKTSEFIFARFFGFGIYHGRRRHSPIHAKFQIRHHLAVGAKIAKRIPRYFNLPR